MARLLDERHSRRPDGGRYPSPSEQTARNMVGPVLAELRRHPEVVGLVVGSFQGASDSVHELQREVARRYAADEWRRMGARSFEEAYGIYLHDVRARWAGVFWSSWAGVMHGRLPCVGHADSGMLRTGDPAGLGRLRRDRGPGVRPRSVSYSGGRAAMGGG